MDLFDFDFTQEENPVESNIEISRMPAVGDKVQIPSIKHEGVIDYIDMKNLFNHHYHPIQVYLEKGYEHQTLYRTNLKDLVYL